MPKSKVSQAEQVRESILQESEERQQEIVRDLVGFDQDHKWLEGEWEDMDRDGEISYSALRYDDDSVLAGFVLKRLVPEGREIGFCVATYGPEEFDQARAELIHYMPPISVLEVWADQMRQSA